MKESIYLKSIDEGYVDSFLSGNIFMKNVKYFHEVEDGAIGGIADGTENMAFRIFKEQEAPVWHVPGTPHPLIGKSISFSNALTDKVSICCFAKIPFGQYELLPNNVLKLSHQYYEDLREFRKRPCVLLEEKDMEKIICSILKQLSPNQRLFHEPVEYYDCSNITMERNKAAEYGDPFAYTKYKLKEKYGHEHEYRLAVNTKEPEDVTFSLENKLGKKVSIVEQRT